MSEKAKTEEKEPTPAKEKATATEPTPDKEPTPAKGKVVIVKVGRQPVGEDGVFHAAGSEFETTPARAKALGRLVEVVG